MARGTAAGLALLMLLVVVVLLPGDEVLRLSSSSCALATAASTAAIVVMLLIKVVSVVACEAEVACLRSLMVADQLPVPESMAGRVLRRTSVGQRVQVSFLRGNGIPHRACNSRGRKDISDTSTRCKLL